MAVKNCLQQYQFMQARPIEIDWIDNARSTRLLPYHGKQRVDSNCSWNQKRRVSRELGRIFLKMLVGKLAKVLREMLLEDTEHNSDILATYNTLTTSTKSTG